MHRGFLNLPWFFWALLSLALSVVWVFVGPHTRIADDSTVRFFVVRWAHALTWLLLASGFFLRGLSPQYAGVANLFAVAGGLAYLTFILATFVVK